MNQNLIANILSLTLYIVSLFISLRAFYLYFQAHRQRLFILGLSMAIISLTAIASFIGDNITGITINLNWFKYTSQTVCFLFILLSLISSSDKYLSRLMLWHIITSVLLLNLLTPIMPHVMPVAVKVLLGGSRSLICLGIFCFYFSAFMTKERLFSLLMSVAFFLLSVGYVLNIPKYGDSHLTLLDNIGDVIRICGLIVLFITVLVG